MKRVIACLVAASASASAADFDISTAEPVKVISRWECATTNTYSHIPIKLAVFDDGNMGWIQVAGDSFPAKYGRYGFERRWDFDLKNGYYEYAFTIDPKGVGVYFDFSRAKPEQTVKPSGVYYCRETESRSN